IATQLSRDGNIGGIPALVGIAHDELAGFDRTFFVDTRWGASLNVRIVQPIFEAERIASVRQFTERHVVHDRDLRKVVMTFAREAQYLPQVLFVLSVYRQGDGHIRYAERIFPVGRGIGTKIIEDRGARRHTLSEFDRKTVQGSLRQT